MASFPPGSRVLARPNAKKQIWRTAKVVEGPPTQDPDIVRVKFVGKTQIFELPSKYVKPAPHLTNSTPKVIDLTDATQQRRPEKSPPVDQKPSLPAYSDPWQHDSLPTVPPSQPLGNQFPISSSSDHNAQRSVAENPKQSSRDWLLGQHSSTQRELIHAPSHSEPSFRSSQRQPQVVSDPSFSGRHIRPNHRYDPDPSSCGALHHRPAGEEPASSSQDSGDEDYACYTPKAHPQSFQFTPIRTDGKSRTHLPHPSAPTGPSSRVQVPLRQAVSRPFSSDVRHPNSAVWTPAPPANTQADPYSRPVRPQPSLKTAASVPLRNGLRTRDHDRHALRSVDDEIRIPRTLAPQKDPTRVPRHPQSSFDDDVPIPRNVWPSRHVTNSMVQGDADVDGSTRPYQAPKRQRLSYDLLARDQLPPSRQMEAAGGKLSRRLAKREKERGGVLDGRNREENSPYSLPYQRVVTHDEAAVRIAPTFDSSYAFAMLPEAISEEETLVLENIFADLSVSNDRILLNNDDELHPRMTRKAGHLVVQTGGRKKSRPKKLRHHRFERRHSASVTSTIGVPNSSADCGPVHNQLVASLRADTTDLNLGIRDLEKSYSPVPRVYGCSCEHESAQNRISSDERYSLQCCMCTLWSHMSCTQLEREQIQALKEGTANGKEKYICMQCVDEHSALGSFGAMSKQEMYDERATWHSSVQAVSDLVSGLSSDVTDKLLHSNLPGEPCRRDRAWIRKPLSEEEISARVDNLEQLRAGMTNASVGIRERALFDDLLGERRKQAEELD